MFFTANTLSALSNEVIARKAPAVFCERPHSKTSFGSGRSNEYLFLPTIKLVDGLRANGWEVVSAAQTMNSATDQENRMTNKHALFLARADHLGRGFNQGDVMPLVKIENSHNGLSSFGLSTGFFRKACANGLTVPESIYSAPKVKHTVNMSDDVVEATYKVLNDFPMLMDMQRSLSSVQLTNDEKLFYGNEVAEIFFDRAEREKLQARARDRHNDRILLEAQLTTARRYDDRKNDLWTVFNVVQENLVRGNVQIVASNNRLNSKRKVTSIDRDNDIHDKLFTLTQKFAEWKGLRIGKAA